MSQPISTTVYDNTNTHMAIDVLFGETEALASWLKLNTASPGDLVPMGACPMWDDRIFMPVITVPCPIPTHHFEEIRYGIFINIDTLELLTVNWDDATSLDPCECVIEPGDFAIIPNIRVDESAIDNPRLQAWAGGDSYLRAIIIGTKRTTAYTPDA